MSTFSREDMFDNYEDDASRNTDNSEYGNVVIDGFDSVIVDNDIHVSISDVGQIWVEEDLFVNNSASADIDLDECQGSLGSAILASMLVEQGEYLERIESERKAVQQGRKEILSKCLRYNGDVGASVLQEKARFKRVFLGQVDAGRLNSKSSAAALRIFIRRQLGWYMSAVARTKDDVAREVYKYMADLLRDRLAGRRMDEPLW